MGSADLVALRSSVKLGLLHGQGTGHVRIQSPW